MFMAFTYEENTHEKVYVCFGNTKEEALGLFFTRTEGKGLPCMSYEVNQDFEPIGKMEMTEAKA